MENTDIVSAEDVLVKEVTEKIPDGILTVIANLARGKVMQLLLIPLAGAAVNGCAVKMHKVETDMGVRDYNWKTKVEELGPYVAAAATDGTNLSVSAKMMNKCTDQRFDTHVMHSHMVPDGSRLPWMIGTSVVLTSLTLTGVGIAVNAHEAYANGYVNESDAKSANAGGTTLAVFAGVPAFFFDTSLLRTLARMAPVKEYEKKKLAYSNEPYECEDADPFTGKATTSVWNASGGPRVMLKDEYKDGKAIMSNSDVPFSYWEDPHWKFQLDTDKTIAKKSGAAATKVTVGGEVATALRHAKAAEEARMAEEAKKAADAERARKILEEQEANKKAELAMLAKERERLTKNVITSIGTWYQDCHTTHKQIYQGEPNSFGGYTYRPQDSATTSCPKHVPVTITLRNKNSVPVNVSTKLLYEYSNYLACSDMIATLKSVEASSRGSVRINVDIDTYQGGFFLSGNCELMGVSVYSMDVTPVVQ